MPWPKQLNRFPLLTIEHVSRSIDNPADTVVAEGVVTNCAEVLEPKESIWLASDVLNSTGILGEIVSYDLQTRRVLLNLWDAENLVAGNSLPLLNHEFNPYQVAMVLDETRRWARRRFLPRDAIASPAPDGFTCLKPIGGGGDSRYYPPQEARKSPAADGQVATGAWDHEHCEICMATISPWHEPEGYVDDQGHWVCCRCFEKYVATHDLSFIAWNSGEARSPTALHQTP